MFALCSSVIVGEGIYQMRREDVDFLKSYLREFAELQSRFRWNPLRVYHGGTWKQVRGIRVLASGIELTVTRGRRFRLYPAHRTPALRERERPFLLTLIQKAMAPARILRIGPLYQPHRGHSPSFLRVLLERSPGMVAVLAAYDHLHSSRASELLCSAVAWWHTLIQGKVGATMLVLMVPGHWGLRFLHALPHLKVPIVCFQYEATLKPTWRQIYPGPHQDTTVREPYVVYPYPGEAPAALRNVLKLRDDLQLSYRCNRWEVAYRGFPLAWGNDNGQILFNRDSPRVLEHHCNPSFLRHLNRLLHYRTFPPPDPHHPYYNYAPERWLESMLIRDHRIIRPDFVPVLYCQVPTWVEGERKVIDLITATEEGRLSVLEIKVNRSFGLIFQGLDYWERVAYHQSNGDFQKSGYFSEIPLTKQKPLLYLVSPLFELHPILPLMKRFLHRFRQWEIVGINADWQREIRILERIRW